MALAIYGSFNGNDSESPKSTPVVKDIVSDVAFACQSFVRNSLNDPESAVFPFYKEASVRQDKKNPDIYRVEFQGRAKNAFGALMLHNFSCTIQSTGSDYRLLKIGE